MTKAEFARWEQAQLQLAAREHYRKQIALAYELAELDRKIGQRPFLQQKLQRYVEWMQRERANVREVYVGGNEWCDEPRNPQSLYDAQRQVSYWSNAVRENQALDYRRTVVCDNLKLQQWWQANCTKYQQEYLNATDN